MMRRPFESRARRWLLLTSLIVVAACVSGDRSIPLGPAWRISDGAHSGGTAGFFFLPPMVPQPVFTGPFDADIGTINPVVAICDVTDGPAVDCGGATLALRMFTITSSPAITLEGEKYKVNWDTKEGNFSPGRSYGVHVRGGTPSRELGFADVLLTTEPGKVKKLSDGEFVALADGRTLPIHFRIEQGVIVPPGDAQVFQLTGLPTSLVAGVSASVTITARDANGNVAGGYRGTVTFSSSDPQAVLPADYTFTAADAGNHDFGDAFSFRTAGEQTLRVADVAVTSIVGEAIVTVLASDAAALEVAGLIDPTGAGTVNSITVTARDADGNIATGYVGTVAFTSGDPQATLPETYTFTAGDAGTHAFPASVTLRTAGSRTVTATDEALASINGSQTVMVTPAAALELVLSGLPDPATAGVANDLTVMARDQFANTATGYTGTVQFSSSDPAATVPTAYQFQASDAGVRTFAGGVTFRTAGLQSFQATDAAIPATTSLAVPVDPAAATQLHFSTQPSDVPEGAPIAPPVVVTALDAFNNVASAFTAQVTMAIGANPGGGTLSGSLQVNAVLGVATFGNLSISADGVGYTLVGSAAGVTSATSDPFTVTSVAPTEVHWVNAGGGLWSVGTNWSTGTPPTPDQATFIDLAGTYTVTLNVNATVRSLSLGAASGAQTLSAGASRVLGISTSGTILSTGRMVLSSATVNGPGLLTNAAGGTLTLHDSDINAPLVNAGTLLIQRNSAVNGPFTSGAGSLVRVQAFADAISPLPSTLTVAAGFTNLGAIELTSTANAGAALTVSSGILVNGPGGTISALVGAGGARILTAQLDNQGTLTVAQPLAINRGSADHVNSGLIQLTGGNLTVSQSGTTPSFTNTGTVTVPAGRTWAITGSGSFTHATGATLDGGGGLTLSTIIPAVFGSAFTLSALTLTNSTVASFATDITTETLALTLSDATVNGPGTVTNAAGKTLTLFRSDINTALFNAGTLIVRNSTSRVDGAFTTQTGSLVRIQGFNDFFGPQPANLTVAAGFTNHGSIELTNTGAGGSASLTVSSGTLINAPGGTISVLAGAGGGSRNLNAQLDNQGTLSVAHPLSINRGSADHLNSGQVNVSGGNLVVAQSGTTPSFINSGTVTLGASRTWTVSGGSLSNASGAAISGAGTFETTSGASLSNSGSITAALVRVSGSLTSVAAGGFAPTIVEFIGNSTIIPVGSGFAYTNIRTFSTAGSITFGGSINLPGFLAVAGNSNMVIGANQIVVGGEFQTVASGVLTMQNAAGALSVGGRAFFMGASTNGRLTAGVLRVAGDFIQQGNAAAFAASGSHVTVLNGTGTQTISFSNPGTTTTTSHFQRLEIANESAAGVVLNNAVFANGQLRTPAGPTVARTITSTGHMLQAGGLDATGLVFDGTPLRVVNGDVITQFDDVTFRNMDQTITQFRLDRLADAVTFNNTVFETVPTGTGLYLHLVDTDLAAPLFTVTMAGTQPPNHGGKIIESVAGQLLGWPL